LGKDFSEMDFMLSHEEIRTWWTQYPDLTPILIGWLAGPNAEKLKDTPDNDILELGLASLSNIFKIEPNILRKRLVTSRLRIGPPTPKLAARTVILLQKTEAARLELVAPVDGKIFFAGEALYSGKDTATVERRVGQRIRGGK